MVHSVVIGGTSGIGREVVKLFVDQGHFVSILGKRSPSCADRTTDNLCFWTLDITEEFEMNNTIANVVRRGKIRNLVFAHRYKGNTNIWNEELAVSLTATKNIIENFVNNFEEGTDNSIVLTSSLASQLVADEQAVGYHVAKAGLNQMARYYAFTLGKLGVRVNTVSPSVFIKAESENYYRQNKELFDLFSKITPLARMGTAREIACVIGFLCSSAASFVTGQNIVVDGGISLQAQPSLACAINL